MYLSLVSPNFKITESNEVEIFSLVYPISTEHRSIFQDYNNYDSESDDENEERLSLKSSKECLLDRIYILQAEVKTLKRRLKEKELVENSLQGMVLYLSKFCYL